MTQPQTVPQDDQAILDQLACLMQTETAHQEQVLDDLAELMQAHTARVEQAVRWYHSRKCSDEEGCSCDMAEEYYAACSNEMLESILHPDVWD